VGSVCRLRRLVLAFVVVGAVWSVPAVASAVDYYLPWTQGSTILCTQGNGGAISHTGATGRYAWDFGFSFGAPVRAAAPGTVIALRQDAADFAPDPNLTTPVNYVLIAHADGTRTGYVHLRYNSLPADIQVGARVLQGQIIGGAGSSGFSSGVHLHFNHYDAAGASIPLSFVEAGVPVGGTRYTSANAEAGAPAHYNPIAPGDTGFAQGGTPARWTSFAGGVYGTASYVRANGDTRDDYARWTFDLARLNGEGRYKVEAYITPTNAGTTNAHYHINTSGGLQYRSVDQSTLSGTWVDLGTYSLSAGSAWVELDDATGEPGGSSSPSIVFDGMRLTTSVSPPGVSPRSVTLVSLPSVSPTRPTHGKHATFLAWVSPGAGAVTGVSTLRLYRYETKTVRKKARGRWRRVRVKYWRLRSTVVMTPDAAGRLAAGSKLRYAGKWKAQVSFSGSATYSASTSGARTFTVR
jgi:murein DD-endopeptidase MepM/ murein hydrolase activator NlpD